jgi:hypothetical protein
MKRTLKTPARGRSLLMIGVALLGASLHGCSPGDGASPGSGAPAKPAASPAPAEVASPKGGRPKVDTTSRRELQKQRAAERAKGGN